jgi:hypothetical protein
MSKKYKKQQKTEQIPVIEPIMETSISTSPIVEEIPLIEFDGWWAMRMNQIPTQHHKEIIKADFKAQGLSKKETVETYDAALRRYGIKF